MSRSAHLVTSPNLFDFFHAEVGRAVEERGTVVSREGVWYLTNLLVEKGHVEAANAPHTLVERRLAAQSANRAEAVTAWRELGDEALYTSGFFRGHVERQQVGLDYYRVMGASAYERVSRLLRSLSGAAAADGPSGTRSLDAVFSELADCFDAASEVLHDVRDAVRAQSDDTSDAGVLRLYEEWQQTGSRRAADRLRELGVLPIRGRPDPTAS